MQVLVVEDDVRLSKALQQILKDNQYQVDAVYDGADGLNYAETGIYDVIILDVMLPLMNGFDVVTALRRKNISTPVLMLTARSEVSDKVNGLDSGADCYMTKPFAPAELLANLRALTRRQGEVTFERATAGDLELDLESQDLSCNGKTIHLSHKEFQLARLLIINQGQTVPKETLLSKVWGYDAYVEDNNAEAYISFLRKKLKFLGSTMRIETLRKIGYRLVPQESDE